MYSLSDGGPKNLQRFVIMQATVSHCNEITVQIYVELLSDATDYKMPPYVENVSDIHLMLNKFHVAMNSGTFCQLLQIQLSHLNFSINVHSFIGIYL